MRPLLKKTQTLIGSWISNMIFTIYRTKPKYQVLLLILVILMLFPKSAQAIVDPLSVSNNKFGIHLIQATHEESSPAASLVNTNGDWGYVTVLIESKDRNHDKWQKFFDDLRRRHLIPLVRLATGPEGSYWKRPYEGEEQAWADFLDSLNWPVKNRYVIIYNEPNHAAEWENSVDPKSYAQILDKTITALKSKSEDFFVLNAGLDVSAPSKSPRYEDALNFMKAMDEAVPGIFNKLDGWVSHSYPQPEFVGSPEAFGRGTVRTYLWEIQQLKDLGLTKDLPIFITETGWKHAEGIKLDLRFPDVQTVSKYYQNAFENAWNHPKIVAVTPFLLNYQEDLFDHFSFKKPEHLKEKIIDIFNKNPETDSIYYPMFETIQNMPKTAGKPVQEFTAKLLTGEIYSSIVAGEIYPISLTFKNTGQSIWNDGNQIELKAIEGEKDLGINQASIPKDIKIEPGQEYTFNLNLKAPLDGSYNVVLNLFEGNNQFSSQPEKFNTKVKLPVILKIITSLGWKSGFAGNYFLKVKGVNGESIQSITLNEGGISKEIEAKHLLPDYSFEFFLEKPFFLTKTINQKVYAGVNTLNFGTLQPNLLMAISRPIEFWKAIFSSK